MIAARALVRSVRPAPRAPAPSNVRLVARVVRSAPLALPGSVGSPLGAPRSAARRSRGGSPHLLLRSRRVPRGAAWRARAVWCGWCFVASRRPVGGAYLPPFYYDDRLSRSVGGARLCPRPRAAGTWFGSFPNADSAFSFVGCTVAPGFDFADFELGSRAALLAEFPEAEELVVKLTEGLP